MGSHFTKTSKTPAQGQFQKLYRLSDNLKNYKDSCQETQTKKKNYDTAAKKGRP